MTAAATPDPPTMVADRLTTTGRPTATDRPTAAGDPDPLALEPLIDEATIGAERRGGSLPGSLRVRYGGDLSIPVRPDRPTVVANFVSTLDGVVSYLTPEAAGGGEISGYFEPDRFVMGLLRSLADAVLVGAGTVRAAPTEAWTPESVHPASAPGFAELRRRLGLGPVPLTVVVTGSGALDLAHPGLSDPDVPALVLTTESGAAALTDRSIPSNVDVRPIGRDRIEPDALLAVLRQRGVRLVLTEGGPHLFGQLLSAGLVDELFLTLAPQVAGRSAAAPRLGLVEATDFRVGAAPWARLVGLRRAGDHLFTRYRFTRNERTDT